jgi:hypothetical protein
MVAAVPNRHELIYSGTLRAKNSITWPLGNELKWLGEAGSTPNGSRRPKPELLRGG